MYYAQGFHLALYDTPLFTEQIKAWQHGPVVPALYYKYSQYGAGAIPIPDKISISLYSKKVKDLLNEIWKICGQFSAWKLRNMTHGEPPYKNARLNGTITRDSMRKYFTTLIKK